MTQIVSHGALGADLTKVYAAISSSTPEIPGLPFRPGTRLMGTDGSTWIFGTAGGAIADNDVCWVNVVSATGLVATSVTTITAANALTAGMVAFNQNGTLASGDSTWFMLSGAPTINVLGSCAKDVPLYTTDTAGSLDDATASASHVQVMGVILSTTISSTTASSNVAVANSPSIRRPVA